MKKIVVDTNVLVSAMYSERSAAREVLRRCLKGDIQPIIGNALFSECEDVFARSEPFETALIKTEDREKVLDAFFSVCVWVNISYLWRPNLRDEGDNHVVELAVAGNANAIITANSKDFRSSELIFPAIQLLTPAQFLKQGD